MGRGAAAAQCAGSSTDKNAKTGTPAAYKLSSLFLQTSRIVMCRTGLLCAGRQKQTGNGSCIRVVQKLQFLNNFLLKLQNTPYFA
jgi:hypothetical protein